MMRQKERSEQLSQWHEGVGANHTRKVERLEERLAKMERNQPQQAGQDEEPKACELDLDEIDEDTPLEAFEATEEEKAAAKVHAKEFVARLELGNGADPQFQSVSETLMPEGTAIEAEDLEQLTAEASEELGEVKLVKTLSEPRVRYDLTMTVTRVDRAGEKRVIETASGKRTVIEASTSKIGPAR